MKRIIGIALGFVLLSATPAAAGQIGVNAARNLLHYDTPSDICLVLVDDYSDYTVEAACFGDGSTWFTVRVTGVGQGQLTATASATGDCSGKVVTVRRRPGGVAIVRVVNTGTFDCIYHRVAVRW